MVIPHTDLTAMNGRDAKALTTSFARSEVLAFQGYKFRRLDSNLVEAKGKPTVHKRRGTGETYVDPHGPYLIDTKARTCTCPAFANRGGCCHLPYALRWLESWEQGESMTVQLVEISKNLIALREIVEGSILRGEGTNLRAKGTRYHCSDGRIVVFRSWELAGAYWSQRPDLIEHTELVELRSIDLEELATTGKYAGLMLETSEGVQEIPLPELPQSYQPSPQRLVASPRTNAAKREDFD